MDQKGGDSNSANWRTRTAVYNTLGQLLTSSNPETGIIDYRYDDDGNLSSRTQPAPNQTNAGTKVTISYSYDEIERLTGKTDGTASTTYSYDANGSGNYGVGRRTGMIDSSGSTTWTYDQVGNVKTVTKTIGTVAKTFSYAYNLDASVAAITYPTGTVLTYTPNAAGQVITVTDAANYKYVSEVHYWPTGALNTGLLGKTGSFAGISLLDTYSSRLQPKRISATSPTLNLIDLNYDFNQGTVQTPINNGTLKAITNALDSNWSRAFTYDELNRVLTAQTPNSTNYGATFSIDPWGNLLGKSAIAGKNVVWSLTEQVSGKNQFTDMDYDAAGNLLNDRIGHSYAYDAENRISSTGGVAYTYDGDGERVKKSNGTLYRTGKGSAPLLETALDGTATAEYVFFNAKRVARIDRPSSAVHFCSAPH